VASTVITAAFIRDKLSGLNPFRDLDPFRDVVVTLKLG
jgi:hypothetical protein